MILALGFSLIALFTCFGLNLQAQNSPKSIKRIIIDPGHGGSDPGSKGKYSTEAAVSLSISIKLEAFIKQAMPDVEVVMTRTSDIYHSVVEKAKIANAAKGDLFVCIHTNSARGKAVKEVVGYTTKTYTVKKKGKKRKVTREVPIYKTTYIPSTAIGTETYIYNVGKSDLRKEVASEMLEDVVEQLDSVSLKQIKEYESELDPTKKMMASILAQQYFQRAASLALTIEEEFKSAGRVSREAKQRPTGIWVLQAVAMPAVLIETGFISNPEEEEYLNSENGQNELCEAITKALQRYKNSLDNQQKANAN